MKTSTSTVITFLACVCCAAAFIQTKYDVFTKQELMDKFLNRPRNYEKNIIRNRGYPEVCNSSIIPPDDGSGSYGDLIYLGKFIDDELLLRETFVGEAPTYDEGIVFWYGNFSGYNVTEVRSLNFGRERGWTKSIYASNHSDFRNVEINVLIPANKTVRMFFEVYGSKNCSVEV